MEGTGKLALRDVDGGAIVPVKVVPGASRNKVAGVLGDVVKITTSVAPEKGRANTAVARTLAEALDVNPRSVHLHAGQTHPRKEFRIEGVTVGDLRKRFEQM